MFRLVLMLTLFLPALALAQEVAPAPAGSSVTQTILWYVIQALSIAVISVAGWGGKKVADKLGIQNSAKVAEMAMSAASVATDAVEEMAAEKWKLGEKPTGTEKHAWAYKMVKKAVPKLADHDVDTYIRAAIARKAGVGATRDRVVGLDNIRDPYGEDAAESDG